MRLNNKAERAAYRAAMLPKGAERDPRSSELGEAYRYMSGDRPAMIAFWGSAARPYMNNWFRDEAAREGWMDTFFADIKSKADYKAKLLAERNAAPRGLEVGDILVSSWGYDQTNIDYYEVTRLVGTKQVEIRMIGAESEETGFMSGRCVPTPGNFIGEPMVKLARNGSVSVRGFACARKMEPTVVVGRKMYSSHDWSSYA